MSFAKFLAAAVAERLVDKLEVELEPRWTADFDDALAPINAAVCEIRKEVSLNGGGSLKDLVLTVSRQLEDLLNTGGSR